MKDAGSGESAEPEVELGPADPGGTSRLRRRSIEIFLEHGPRKLEILRQTLSAGEAEAFATAAHALVGSAGFVGASRLAELARELEELALEGQLERCESQLRQVEGEHLRVERALGRLLRSEDDP